MYNILWTAVMLWLRRPTVYRSHFQGDYGGQADLVLNSILHARLISCRQNRYHDLLGFSSAVPSH